MFHLNCGSLIFLICHPLTSKLHPLALFIHLYTMNTFLFFSLMQTQNKLYNPNFVIILLYLAYGGKEKTNTS